MDEEIYHAVYRDNEYRLPEAFSPDDVVLDIGAHIGSFVRAALDRGAGRINAFEANPQNFAWLAKNVGAFSERVTLSNKAVWRSDRPATMLYFAGSRDERNTGGGCVYGESGIEVEAVPFDDVVREITDSGRQRVKLLKIDCEGAEFPILLTAKTLSLIDHIVGEFHEFGEGGGHIQDVCRVPGFERFTIAELTAFLEKAGFAVKSERNGTSTMGLFFAHRGPW
jgi:FkbM family methyltransferase